MAGPGPAATRVVPPTETEGLVPGTEEAVEHAPPLSEDATLGTGRADPKERQKPDVRDDGALILKSMDNLPDAIDALVKDGKVRITIDKTVDPEVRKELKAFIEKIRNLENDPAGTLAELASTVKQYVGGEQSAKDLQEKLEGKKVTVYSLVRAPEGATKEEKEAATEKMLGKLDKLEQSHFADKLGDRSAPPARVALDGTPPFEVLKRLDEYKELYGDRLQVRIDNKLVDRAGLKDLMQAHPDRPLTPAEEKEKELEARKEAKLKLEQEREEARKEAEKKREKEREEAARISGERTDMRSAVEKAGNELYDKHFDKNGNARTGPFDPVSVELDLNKATSLEALKKLMGFKERYGDDLKITANGVDLNKADLQKLVQEHPQNTTWNMIRGWFGFGPSA